MKPLDPRFKLIAALILILGVLLIPDRAFPAYPLMWAAIASVGAVNHISAWTLARRGAIALPFALVAITLLFTTAGSPVFTIGAWSISDAGVIRFIGVMLKTWLAAQISIVLTLTTPFTDVLWALESLGVPAPLVQITAVLYRYLFTLRDEAARLRSARAARSASIDGRRSGGTLSWRAQVAGSMIGSLFLRSTERSERVYAAMAARGFEGHTEKEKSINAKAQRRKDAENADDVGARRDMNSQKEMDNMIRVEGLSYTYPDGKTALSGLSFQIQRGEKVALVGANGAGKSTLLMLLNGVLRTPDGTITIGGRVLNDQTIGQIRAQVGLVFQDPDDQLFSTSVYQDVAYGAIHMGLSPAEVEQRVSEALNRVGMSAHADRMPYHLSGGEKKRVAIAAVLSMQPDVLILDEPSAGLDPRGRRTLITLLESFTEKTLLISTHDMHLAHQLCTRVIVLDDGKIAADGDSAALLNDSALMERHGL